MRIVESNGGKFDRNIEKDITTHLICLQPEGDKYCAAKSWKNVFIVTVEWIDSCVQKQSNILSHPSLKIHSFSFNFYLLK